MRLHMCKRCVKQRVLHDIQNSLLVQHKFSNTVPAIEWRPLWPIWICIPPVDQQVSHCKRLRGRKAHKRKKGEAVVLQMHRYAFLHTHPQSHFFLKWLFFFSIFWLVIYPEDSRFYRVFRANGTLKIIVCIKYRICSCCERQRWQSIDCVSTGRWCSVRFGEVGGEQQSSLVCESWHPSLSPCYISMTHSISGRAAAGEQCDRGETRGCGLDSTGRDTGGK